MIQEIESYRELRVLEADNLKKIKDKKKRLEFMDDRYSNVLNSLSTMSDMSIVTLEASNLQEFVDNKTNSFDPVLLLEFWRPKMKLWTDEDKFKFVCYVSAGIFREAKEKKRAGKGILFQISVKRVNLEPELVTIICKTESKALAAMITNECLTLPRCEVLVVDIFNELNKPTSYANKYLKVEEALGDGISIQTLNASSIRFGYAFDEFDINLFAAVLAEKAESNRTAEGKKIGLGVMVKALAVAKNRTDQVVEPTRIRDISVYLKGGANTSAQEILEAVSEGKGVRSRRVGMMRMSYA